MISASFTEMLESLNLSQLFPGLPPAAYAISYALITVFIFLISAKIIYYVIGKQFMKIAGKTKTDLDDKLLKLIRKPIYYVMILFGIRLALHWIDVPTEYAPWVDGILFVFIVLIAFYVLAKIIDVILIEFLRNLAKGTKTEIDEQLLGIVDKFLIILVYAIGFMVILGQFGVEITPFIASLGIMGLVIAFAAQESLSNIFGGIFIMVDKSFRVGDRVEIGKDGGKVINVGLRSTKIETFDGNILTIPNAELSKSNIVNYSLPKSSVRKTLDFGVAYGTDIEKASKIVEKVVKRNKYVSKRFEPRVLFWEIGDFALKIRTIYWVDDWQNGWSSMDEINRAVLSEFAKNKIQIPFPVTHVLFEDIKKGKKKSR